MEKVGYCMELYYEGIKLNVVINDYKINDNMGGKCDSISVTFADIKHECRKWDFKKNDIIEIVEYPFSSGKMFVDGYSSSNGYYTIEALSIKKKFKTKNTKPWENVRFLDLAKDLIKDHGLHLETYGVENYLYTRVDEIEQNDIEFLDYRCKLEGYNLKITDGKAVIVSEEYLEKQDTILTVSSNEFIDKYEFECTSNKVFGGCEISSFSGSYIKGNYIIDDTLELLKINNITVYNIEEANRFAKNILRSYNKKETTGYFFINKNNNIAAGNTIKVDNLALFNGKYIIENLYSTFNGKTKLKVRKVLEGY
ncbi:hypothetical protein FDF11_13380 [Clostridium botulinum]|nr:hypothetical protein [Clostridium botulinum]NFR14767.1 hypothetical protein [Clostridium botulinum]NFR44749.1 hypothetical protein [Clostridium botulinum]NFS51632.1 hypothetical protein [Clostridium botulinum]